jgi:hypothetical protein
MTSTALGFQARRKDDVVVALPVEPEHASPPSIKPRTSSEMGVDTSDIPFPPTTIDVPNQDEPPKSKEPLPVQVQKPKQLEEPESSLSATPWLPPFGAYGCSEYLWLFFGGSWSWDSCPW